MFIKVYATISNLSTTLYINIVKINPHLNMTLIDINNNNSHTHLNILSTCLSINR
ncbi:protein of unknown function [Clostridium beijerinckii]|nr:protein of unknown function [Clostridium beijerinckii]